MAKKARRKPTPPARAVKLQAASLTTAAPVLGQPPIGQALSAASLTTAPPEFKPSLKQHFYFDSADSSRPPRGRPRDFTEAEIHQLQAWLTDQLKDRRRLPYVKDSVRIVKKLLENQINLASSLSSGRSSGRFTKS
jgi:hypothetical protein